MDITQDPDDASGAPMLIKVSFFHTSISVYKYS